MIKVGFTLIGRGNWSGGETYLRNMLGVIAAELKGEVEARLFLSPEQAQKIGNSFDFLLAEPPIIDAVFSADGRTTRMLSSIVTGTDKGAAQIFASCGIDVVFESAHFYGWRFPVPLLSWIPDFQHRRLPHYFTNLLWWKRDIGFQLQSRTKRLIMLSSEDSQSDCLKFYPASAGKTAVVRFAVDVDPIAELARANEIKQRYALPDRFFYLPNQFWAHKNHELVLNALILVKAAGELNNLPPIVMTGRTEDPRNPGIFDALIERAKSEGVDGHFRYLGLIPYADVFGLNAAADALINPSSFEGWSTTVEEAKALGTRMLLSDIPLHREQAPGALFFDLRDARSLATLLQSVASIGAFVRKPVSELASDHMLRRASYAKALLAAFNSAIELR